MSETMIEAERSHARDMVGTQCRYSESRSWSLTYSSKGDLSWEQDLSASHNGTVWQQRRETCPGCQGLKETVPPGRACTRCGGKRVVEDIREFEVGALCLRPFLPTPTPGLPPALPPVILQKR